MPTVQRAVNDELERNPILVDLLGEGVINVSAVAARISPQVAKETGKEPTQSAVGMAIRRFVDMHPRSEARWQFPAHLEIATRSQVYEVAIEKTPEVPGILKRLHARVRQDKGEFLSVVEGTYELMIFTNQAKKAQVREALRRHRITSEVDNLAYVSVNWPKETKDVPGIYYRITRALAFRGISIQSFHTIGAEMLLFFKEDALMEGYRTVEGALREGKGSEEVRKSKSSRGKIRRSRADRAPLEKEI